MPKTTIHAWLTTKRAIIILALIMSAILLFTPYRAQSYGYNWDITLDADIQINTDSSLNVTETIVADFTNDAHHGIYRSIPVRYRDKYNQSFKLRFDIIGITDEQGNNLWYEKSGSGDYINLKIGDPESTFTEPKTYILKYKIQRAVSFAFDDHDELYWNATGEEWEIPISKATATITYPDTIDSEKVKSTCFTGGYGATGNACRSEIVGNSIFYETTAQLNSYEGLTIVAGLPKGYLEAPPALQQLAWTLADNWGYFIPIFTFLLLYYLWWTRGRDDKTSRDTIMPIYTPPDSLTPSEAGTLIDEKVDIHDISATIIDMAVRGYLKINETTKKGLVFSSNEYEFERLKDFASDNTLKEHERLTLEAVFGSGKKKSLSTLKYNFYKDIPGIKKAIYSQLIEKKYFNINPDNIRGTYYGIGSALIGIPFFTVGFFIDYSIAIPLGLAAGGIIVLLFAKHMPAKTKKGSEAYFEVLGLEEFIKTAEKDRIKWQEKENIFEKLLPYAMAFGIADRWSDTFKGIYKTPPDWYTSNDPNFLNNFSTGYLIGRLNSFSNTMQNTFTAAPRSSSSGGSWSGGSGFGGGGFSGGGFGGGGGGGW